MDYEMKQQLDAIVMTPMFSSGNKQYQDENKFSKSEPEIRTSELKALMRFIYRIISTEQKYKVILKNEGELFGNAENNASPIRLQIIAKTDNFQDDYLRYGKEKTKNKSIPVETKLFIFLRKFRGYNDPEEINVTKWNLYEYKEMLELALVLGGLGRRARRARGSISTEFTRSMSLVDLKQWIVKMFNDINDLYQSVKPDKPAKYILSTDQETIIGPDCTKNFRRPVIRKIIFGEKLCSIDLAGIKKFLSAVDDASHQIKCSKDAGSIYATGHIPIKNCNRKIFSSSVIVSVVKLTEGVYPIYTVLNACHGGVLIPNYESEQNEFVQLIESKREKSKI